jgi:hypothetical protein
VPDNLRSAFGFGDAQERADIEQHPYASFAGGMVPYALAMRPGMAPAKQVALGAALGGGIEAGQEALGPEGLDPAKIAMATAGGALLNRPTRLGRALGVPDIAPVKSREVPIETPEAVARNEAAIPKALGAEKASPQAVAPPGKEGLPEVASTFVSKKSGAKENIFEIPATGEAPVIGVRPSRAEIQKTEDDLFRAMRSRAQEENILLKQDLAALPPEMKNAPTLRELFLAQEGDPSVRLTPEKLAMQSHIQPWIEEGKEIFIRNLAKGKAHGLIDEEIRDLEFLDPTYAHRVRKDKVRGLDEDIIDVMPQTMKGSGIGRAPGLEARSFHVIEDPATGARQVVRTTDETISRVLPGGETEKLASGEKGAFERGQTVELDGKLWNIKNARSEEIHALNIPIGRGEGKVEFLQDAAFAARQNLKELRLAELELDALQQIKDHYVSTGRMTTDKRAAKPDWIESRMTGYKNHWMDPRIAHALDDFAPKGKGEAYDTLEALSKANRRMIGALFWNPIPHILNVAGHAIVANGWQNFNPLHFPASIRNAMKAAKEVGAQGELYQDMLHEGSSLLYSRVANTDMYSNYMKEVGHALPKMEGFTGLAKSVGLKPVELYNGYMRAMSKTLWWAGDVFMMHRVMELEAKGVPRRQAIFEAERDIPNYRVPSEVWQGPGGRLMSRALRDTTFNLFGRFHYGVARGLGTIVKDLAVGDKEARIDAMGKAVALATLSGIIYPVIMDPLARALSGSEDVEAARRGPTGPVQTAIEAVHAGKITDWSGVARAAGFMAAPVTNFATGIATGKDWRGQNILEPASSLPARVGQGLQFLGQTAVPPFGQYERYQKMESPGRAFAADIFPGYRKTPPPQGWAAAIGERSAAARAKKPRGSVEALFADEYVKSKRKPRVRTSAP